MSTALNEKFTAFASYGRSQVETTMEGSKFAKLCKDCGLVDKKFTTTSVDIIFSKAKTKGTQKITFAQFQEALAMLAAEKGMSIEEVESKIVGAEGPKTQATQPDYVKFHDDKSTYTGVYAKGGPTNVDGTKDLSGLCDRTSADVRGVSATSNFAKAR